MRCCFCGEEIIGYGNNPLPFGNSGDRCCDVCNEMFVIPGRLAQLQSPKRKCKVGDEIGILWLKDEPTALDYMFRKGTIDNIDDIGQLHGTWGGLAVDPQVDAFVILD